MPSKDHLGIEPQVLRASQILTIKGYGPHSSGFDDYDPEEFLFYSNRDPHLERPMIWQSIGAMTRIPTPGEIEIIESVPGAVYDVLSGGIFVDPTGKTLGEVKEIFDRVAEKLPYHGQSASKRFLGIEKAINEKNRHFIMKRESRRMDSSFSEEQYLRSFISYCALSVFRTPLYADCKVVLNSCCEAFPR